MTRLRILIVSPRAEIIREWLKGKADSYFNLSIYIALSGVDGLRKVQKYLPVFIIADNNLPDMNGMSFASITKDTIEGQESHILVFGIDTFLINAKADSFLPPLDDRQLQIFLTAHMESYLKNKYFVQAHREEYESRKTEQLNQLPKNLDNEFVSISNIFSPYDELSGDGFDYWIPPGSQYEGVLYGFLYDCTGHGPESYPFVSSIRKLMKKNLKLYERHFFHSLAEVMKKANSAIMDTTPGNEMTPAAAVAFYVDFKGKLLKYCTAGIPSFYVRYTGKHGFEKMECRNYLLGMFPDVDFDEEEMSLSGVDELVFASDGLSEIIYHQNDDDVEFREAKHDDVSAINIKLKRPK